MSLIEILVVIAIMSIGALLMATMHTNQLKSNNYLEFQLARTQLQNTLIGQFLNNPDNCRCLFTGANVFSKNPVSPGATLTGVNPTTVGVFDLPTPGSCVGASVPDPFINNLGIAGLKFNKVELNKILNISGSYFGKFSMELESVKSTAGPKTLTLERVLRNQVLSLFATR